jgi:hypothetical protein
VAVANKNVDGGGTAPVTFPDGTTVNNSQIYFLTTKSKGQGFGFFQIQGPEGFKGGFLNAKTINQNRYDLRGAESGDFICNSSVPTTVTISGNCGQGAISFVAANGQRGTFSGSTACF